MSLPRRNLSSNLVLFTLLITSLAACSEDKDPIDTLTTNMTVGHTGDTGNDTDGITGATTDGITDGITGDAGATTDAATTDVATTAGDTTAGTGEADISGEFLLAISTVIAPDLPLQFLSTNQVTIDMKGGVTITSDLQPLALHQGKVTQPRTPIGDPLHYGPEPVVDGEFSIDAGTVMVSGMANPITGGDLVVSLKLDATIISPDFYCGTITGDLMIPLMASLNGSTFAALRVAGPMALPLDVAKNCDMDTTTDTMP